MSHFELEKAGHNPLDLIDQMLSHNPVISDQYLHLIVIAAAARDDLGLEIIQKLLEQDRSISIQACVCAVACAARRNDVSLIAWLMKNHGEGSDLLESMGRSLEHSAMILRTHAPFESFASFHRRMGSVFGFQFNPLLLGTAVRGSALGIVDRVRQIWNRW